MTKEFDPEIFDAIRATLVSRPELTKDLNVSLRNVLRLAEHLQNSGLRMERHGRWIKEPSLMAPNYKCSKCGAAYEWWESYEAHYCPNCGAKMDGGDGDD